MSNEIEVVSLVDTWLHAILSGDSTLSTAVGGRVIGDVGDIGTFAVPFVQHVFQSTRDISTADGTIIDTDSLYVVKVVGESGSWSALEPVAARIHTLIHGPGVTRTLSGGSLTCVRERIVKQIEEEAGRQYRHLGGQYRIRANRE
jgi:hypothetical protein